MKTLGQRNCDNELAQSITVFYAIRNLALDGTFFFINPAQLIRFSWYTLAFDILSH
ncbi:conserved hypothetical protein [Alteromonas macleodii]